MRRATLLAALFAVGLILAWSGGFHLQVADATSGLVPAHSHWDGINDNYELKFSFTPQAAAAGAGSTFGWIPFRAQDSQDYLQLDLTASGYRLEKRVAGTQTVIAPDFKTTQRFGVGTEMLADLVVQGSSITLYAMSDTQVRGAKLYHWSSTAFPTGKYISYYTQLRWFGYWEFVHEIPLDSSSEPHDILDLTQDARATSSPGGSATFDDPHPSSGGATNRGHTETYGIAHAGAYTFSFNVTGTGPGHADFLDPVASGKFFQAGFYRLTVGAKSTLQRMTGSGTLAQTWPLSQSGPGVYTVALSGSQVTVSKGGTVIGRGSGGPSSGIRLRISAAGQTWVWTGTAAGSTPPTTTTTPTTTTAPTTTTVPTTTVPTTTTTPAATAIKHVVWVLEENHPIGSIIGSSSAPYINGLASTYGLATHLSAETHPSLPNYIALTSGSTQGITDDATPPSHPLAVDNLFNQIETKGGSWGSFQESIGTSLYLIRHDPGAYYTNLAHKSADISTMPFDNLPTFSFVTPNRNDDMHDGTVAQGDTWLKGWLPKLLGGASYRSGDTLVVVTWDEGNQADNTVATILLNPKVGHRTVATAYTHYSLLRLTEDLLGVPRLGNAAPAADMRAAFGL